MKQFGSRGIIPSSLDSFSHKKVVVDTSIYLYRFKSSGNFMEHMDSLIRMFLQYDITPIFVFDGPPRPNKKELLKERRHMKETAWNLYHSSTELNEYQTTRLRNAFTKVSKKDVDSIKELMQKRGVQYIDAPHESDEVCAFLSLNGTVDACVSDDMDMFLYGCSTVLRDLNLDTHTMMRYDTEKILRQLNLSHHEFKQICVLSGSDYYKSSFTLYTVMNMFRTYQHNSPTLDFYGWVSLRHKVDLDALQDAYDAFTIDHVP